MIPLLLSTLVLLMAMSVRIVYSVDIHNVLLWGATVFASWASVFAIGYLVAMAHCDHINRQLIAEHVRDGDGKNQ